MSELYRLVYASKNLLEMSEAEASAAIAQILETSRRNNAKVEVTGALLFNGGAFAQVLEGPRRAVESTFERIQRDERHGEVTVLQCGPAERRGFPNWSMGFVGHSARGRALWGSLADESGFDLGRLDGDAVFTTLHSLVLDDEGVPASALDHPAVEASPQQTVPELDVARIRAELPRPGQTLQSRQAEIDTPAIDPVPSHPYPEPSIAASSSAIALTVLREALAAERERTTELRNTLDGMQIALATSQDRASQIARERDLWARRARLLAMALGQEATAAGADAGVGDPAGEPVGVPARQVREAARAVG
ncbi:BLUF domain-containing protein [Methylobacterium pseudosasicola]|uniref:Sensors of blue-light using FAD n=1 Tax=Methylobacterium pseudosasicola TaxID=582667 RepID=A0A1I4H430_9HYPH|nr:BLUF domain-containing protein [Methylobacterium pseudosasicola]SFL36955.1 Sensors of blue-light using FAD [Methylobacterium pseudosasicola]